MSPSNIAASAWRAEASTRIAGVVDEDHAPRRLQLRSGRVVLRRRTPLSATSSGAERIDQHVRQVHEDFLLIGDLVAIGLHRKTE